MGRNSKDNSLGRVRKVLLIRDNYFYCLRNIKTHKLIKLSSKDTSDDFKKYVDKVERVFNRLDPIYKMIINKEFFYNDYKMWWVSLYTRSTFYRIRAQAVISFLEEFN